ncbi:hypothetical protein KCU88_g7146, partial [Aureobasidium melanogenum]
MPIDQITMIDMAMANFAQALQESFRLQTISDIANDWFEQQLPRVEKYLRAALNLVYTVLQSLMVIFKPLFHTFEALANEVLQQLTSLEKTLIVTHFILLVALLWLSIERHYL